MTEREWRVKLSEIIKEKMAEHGINQTDLAKRVGVKQALVSRWCHAENTPTGWNLVKLCTVLDLDIKDITHWTVFDWQAR